ncbi:hypothetical protein N7495_004676 [Penicillium taxi]|uniref:uncharacterized protein n=1 Tax=Penicillium taxi TaxID=168475 RepID=UPI002545B426|nr:uncharacterized protein N7495_004676 [Penicillium taxi]KAJ5899932.1 hypothetical protein N7495_004676 [Penicillium taxi]
MDTDVGYSDKFCFGGQEMFDHHGSSAADYLTGKSGGRSKEAEEIQMQAMDTSKQVLKPEDPDTLISIANPASTHRNQGRCNEAEKLRWKF